MSMEIYHLTARGEELAHSFRNPRTPEWAVIHFLNKRGSATKEQIYEGVPSASSSTLARLAIRRIISVDRRVEV